MTCMTSPSQINATEPIGGPGACATGHILKPQPSREERTCSSTLQRGKNLSFDAPRLTIRLSYFRPLMILIFLFDCSLQRVASTKCQAHGKCSILSLEWLLSANGSSCLRNRWPEPLQPTPESSEPQTHSVASVLPLRQPPFTPWSSKYHSKLHKTRR